MREYVVAGIDPGLASTGFAVVRFAGGILPQLLHTELIKTSAEKGLKGRSKLLSDRDRTETVGDAILTLIAERHADAVSLEDFVFMGNRGRAESQTVRIVESILVKCRSAGLETEAYDNAYWKTVLMQCRTATKEQVRHFVCRAMGLDIEVWGKKDRGGHLLDAAALALTHAKLLKLKGVDIPWSTAPRR